MNGNKYILLTMLLFLFSLVLHVVCVFEATPHTVSLIMFSRVKLKYKQKEKMPNVID